MENERKSMLKLAIAAFCLVAVCVPVFLLSGYLMFWPSVGLLLMLAAVLMPFAGIIMGIVALCLGKRKGAEVVLASLAIAIPVVAAFVSIVLFSTGVWVIRFM